ncbi:hypothetical protein AAVH_18361 [Aphelenchoides avenae]|nr:hypothetical protein AAVH_18361 [Aphelenchus avenae]
MVNVWYTVLEKHHDQARYLWRIGRVPIGYLRAAQDFKLDFKDVDETLRRHPDRPPLWLLLLRNNVPLSAPQIARFIEQQWYLLDKADVEVVRDHPNRGRKRRFYGTV